MQIEIINPKILVLLGATALKNMAGEGYKITRDHGIWLDWQNRLAMPVFHPAALLRDPSLKRDTWEDFKKIYFKYCELVNPQHYSPYILNKHRDQ
jgi:DNA polymerase